MQLWDKDVPKISVVYNFTACGIFKTLYCVFILFKIYTTIYATKTTAPSEMVL
jgi:hypothetical protein